MAKGKKTTRYVSPGGNDAQDGLSPHRALRTIQRAADLAEPGDVIEVAGGIYFEQVTISRGGKTNRPVIFRAAKNQTPVVTFGQKLGNWCKSADRRFVYEATCPCLPACVWEDRDVVRYAQVPTFDMLDDLPGSFLFDAGPGRLYVHPLLGSSPGAAEIVVIPAVEKNGMPAKASAEDIRVDACGICLHADHVHVEGFAISYHPRAGIEIRGDFGRVEGNTVYGCLGGIAVNGGNEATVARNHCFRNHSHGIVSGGGNRGVAVRDNFCCDNGPEGAFAHFARGYGLPMNIAVYGKTTDVSFTGNTAISKHADQLWRYKSALGKIETRRNVIVGGSAHGGWGDEALYSFNTVVGGAFWSRSLEGGEITPEAARCNGAIAEGNLFLKEDGFEKAGFADHCRHDYRLRTDSPFVGSGAFPKVAALWYVSPEGDDAHDGRTPTTAWRTLSKAAAQAMPGDTVYALPGMYAEEVAFASKGESDRPIAFRTYGRGQVVLDGQSRLACGLLLLEAEGVVIDGLIVKGFTEAAVRIEGCRDVELLEVVLDGGIEGVSIQNSAEVRVVNCTLANADKGISASGGKSALVLCNSLFSSIREAGIVIDKSTARGLASHRNAFAPGTVAGRIAADCAVEAADWVRLAGEAHPSVVGEVVSGPDYALSAGSPLSFQGLGHRPIGARGAASDTRPVEVEGFEVASVLPDQVVVAWRTPFDYVAAQVTWKGMDGAEGTVRVAPSDGSKNLKQTWRAARLAGLSAGQTYQVALCVCADDGRTGRVALNATTPVGIRKPACLHVAPDGDDRNDGMERNRAVRTLRTASLKAIPGDTVLVYPGVYNEKLKFWSGGISPDQRLTFRSVEPGKAVIDLGRLLPGAISAEGVRHIAVEGFHIRGLWYAGVTAVEMQDVEDLLFAYNSFELPERKDEVCSSTLFRAQGCRGLTIRNNCFNGGFNNLIAQHCDHVAIDHNTFYKGGVTAIIFDGAPDAHCRITSNIFADVMAPQKGNAAINVYHRSAHLVCDHNLFWRHACPHMGLFRFHFAETGAPVAWHENAKTITEMIAQFGVGHHSTFADPLFADAPRGDMRLQSGSPALEAGEGGSTAGAFGVFEKLR